MTMKDEFEAYVEKAFQAALTKEDLKVLPKREDVWAMRSEIVGMIDAFMNQLANTDRAQIIADWRLAQLEKRVTDIEARPS